MGNNSSVNMVILQKLIRYRLSMELIIHTCIKYDQYVVRYGFVWMDRRRQNYISPTLSGDNNIGITHVFSCIDICRVPGMLFEHEADRPSVQHHPRDPASVNAMKQTCVIVILAYFTLFQPNSH